MALRLVQEEIELDRTTIQGHWERQIGPSAGTKEPTLHAGTEFRTIAELTFAASLRALMAHYFLLAPDSTFAKALGRLTEARSEEPMSDVLKRLSRIERILSSTALLRTTQDEMKLREKVVEELKGYLAEEYSGKVVAITYDGKVVGSSNNEVELLKEIRERKIPSAQVFLHRVGKPAFEGWF